MAGQISKDQDKDKVDEYFNVIHERILAPFQKTEIQNYCTVTLLILFPVTDGLGKLLHSDSEANVHDRFFEFLDYMGGDYKVPAVKKELWKLRNSLVHNAISVESFLSKTEMSADQHLKTIGAPGYIYVNTKVMCKDCLDAFRKFSDYLNNNPVMMKRAADRLEWREEREDLNIPTPSLPPSVRFIYTK